MTEFFLDTTVIVDAISGELYAKRCLSQKFATCLLNVWEMHYVLLRLTQDPRKASIAFDVYKNACIPFTKKDMKDANIFRYAHKERKLSYVDALGYTLAQKHGAVFVTGDRGFVGLPGVELIT